MLICAALAGAASARADPIARWSPAIAEASSRFAIPKQWIRRVILAESGGYTMLEGRPIVSSAGAMGLMQLMPNTWLEMRSELALGQNPFDPHDNIIAGAAYLKSMYERFGYPGLFAAYNAGPARYAAYLSGTANLPFETRSYVARIVPISRSKERTAAKAAAGLFAVRLRRGTEEGGEAAAPALGELFVQTAPLGAN